MNPVEGRTQQEQTAWDKIKELYFSLPEANREIPTAFLFQLVDLLRKEEVEKLSLKQQLAKKSSEAVALEKVIDYLSDCARCKESELPLNWSELSRVNVSIKEDVTPGNVLVQIDPLNK